MIQGLKGKMWEERLEELEKRRLWEDLIAVFCYEKDCRKQDAI